MGDEELGGGRLLLLAAPADEATFGDVLAAASGDRIAGSGPDGAAAAIEGSGTTEALAVFVVASALAVDGRPRRSTRTATPMPAIKRHAAIHGPGFRRLVVGVTVTPRNSFGPSGLRSLR
jgi:hypothetical protein